jgi:hypothetical protein
MRGKAPSWNSQLAFSPQCLRHQANFGELACLRSAFDASTHRFLGRHRLKKLQGERTACSKGARDVRPAFLGTLTLA